MSLIAITAAGRKLLDELLPEHFAAERAMASVLGANEKELLISLLGPAATAPGGASRRGPDGRGMSRLPGVTPFPA